MGAIGWVKTGLGFVSGLAGNISANKNIDKQITAQREENEKNREYNLNLARLQNQWNIEQWNRENAYNTPAAQRARLAAAGMNPDLAYGEGVSANIAASSPEMTAGAPSVPTDVSNLANKQTIGDAVRSAMQLRLVESQAKANDAGAKKTDQETKNLAVENNILSADALTRAMQNEWNIEFTKSQVYYNHALAKESHANAENLAAKTNNLNVQTENLYVERDALFQKIKNMEIEVVQKKFDMWLKSKEFDLQVKQVMQSIKESDSRINLNYTQAADILATQTARVMNLNASTYLQGRQAENEIIKGMILDVNYDEAKFNFDQAKDFDSASRVADIAAKWMSGLGAAVGSFAGAFVGLRGALQVPKMVRPYRINVD